MLKVTKRMEIAGSHELDLPYASACCNVHGHNWIVDVEISADTANASGMLMDFKHIKIEVHRKLDHKHINDILDVNPTAENIACWIRDEITMAIQANEPDYASRRLRCSRVSVQESEGNVAIWEEE